MSACWGGDRGDIDQGVEVKHGEGLGEHAGSQGSKVILMA